MRPRQINGLGCHERRWSPDGTKIIFAANSSATGTNIYIANADGTGLSEITADGGDDDPSWGLSPTPRSAVAAGLARS